jgi:hypothetical protein
MIIKYDASIKNEAIRNNLQRLINQIYKLLPSREEKSDWEKPLGTIIEELAGMDRLFLDYHDVLFTILSKLEGLFTLKNEEDFLMFRKTIFECLNLINRLVQLCQ